MLRVAATVPCTVAEGPFRRFALWVRGCSLRCAGCCNPEFFEAGDESIAVGSLRLEDARDAHALEGVTILGGEPLEQIEGVIELAEHARALGLGGIVFSGYTRAEAARREGFARLWSAIDTLVDGRFDARALDRDRRYVGSTNQVLHHRTDRYADPELWRGPKRVEIHIRGGDRVHVNGDPGTAHRVLTSPPWRSPRRSSGS